MNLRVGQNRFWVVLLTIALLVAVLPADRAAAILEGCSVNASPSSASAGTDTSFNFSVTNNASSSIEWVKVEAPGGGYFTMESGSANHWTVSHTSGDVTFTNWSLTPSRSQNFSAQAFPNMGSNALNWTVLASDDPAGANAISCSGNTGVAISSTPVSASNVQVSGVGEHGATISWSTNVPGTSQVNYGTSSSYGSSSPQDSSLVISHSVALSSLSAGTAYHFQVVSSAPGGGSDSSGDDTFVTVSAVGGASAPTKSSKNEAPLPSSHAIPILKVPVEATPPTVSVTSQLPRVQKTEPTVRGVASDKVAVARVEFSTDDGVNWLPAQQATGLGTPQVSFSFKPVHLNDGTYSLVVRAVNTSGIITKTAPITIVIDRLNPIIGGNVISLGPQLLTPDQDGTITTMAGVNQKITLSTVGGPTTVTLTATSQAHPHQSQTFSLTKASDTGLWAGDASFAGSGAYELLATATDGAGTATTESLNQFNVAPPARAIDAKTHRGIAAQVSVYYYEPDTQSWVVWDGASYGQQNPQRTDKQGQFQLFLPAGKYYLTAKASGYRALVSSIFTATRTEPVSTTLRLQPIRQLRFGPLHISLIAPSLADQSFTATAIRKDEAVDHQSSLIGKPAPDFSLTDTNGSTVNTTDLLGKPTILTFGTTWAPSTAEQMGALSSLQSDHNLNVMPVALQQGAAITRAYTNIAGLDLNWLVDPTSSLSSHYDVESLPTSYFIDRNGIVQKVIVGVLTRQQILTDLSSLP